MQCVGLVNPRTMCFMNASFQVLFHLPPLVAWIEEMESTDLAKKGYFTGKVMRLFRSMQLSRGHASANEFWSKNVIRQICAE